MFCFFFTLRILRCLFLHHRPAGYGEKLVKYRPLFVVRIYIKLKFPAVDRASKRALEFTSSPISRVKRADPVDPARDFRRISNSDSLINPFGAISARVPAPFLRADGVSAKVGDDVNKTTAISRFPLRRPPCSFARERRGRGELSACSKCGFRKGSLIQFAERS